MARTTKPLTNTEVQQAKPKDKEFNLVDGNGLALRVKPNGSKLWIFNYYRPYTKKRTSLSLGTYPAVTLAEARKRRSEAKELLATDIDPKEHREERSRISEKAHNNTLEYIAAQWLDVKKADISRSRKRYMALSLTTRFSYYIPHLRDCSLSLINLNYHHPQKSRQSMWITFNINYEELLMKKISFYSIIFLCLISIKSLMAAEIVNINTADAITIAENLSGIGPTKATAKLG